MKLIVCDGCHDVVALRPDLERRCYCGESGGAYAGQAHVVEVFGPCRVLGLENSVRYGTARRSPCWEIGEPHATIRRPEGDGPFAVLLRALEGGCG